jgi:hypothetical protein
VAEAVSASPSSTADSRTALPSVKPVEIDMW